MCSDVTICKFMNRRDFLLLLTLILLVTNLHGDQQVDLVQHFVNDPNDQSFVESGIFKDINNALNLRKTTLKTTDLTNEEDSHELSCVVVCSKPSFFDDKNLARFPLKKKVLFMWEPPVVQKDLYSKRFTSKFKRVYTWNDDLVDNKKFFKFYYPVLIPTQPDLPKFEERKLLTQISSRKKSDHKKELYTERVAVIQYFQDKPEGEFEFYGSWWGVDNYSHYKGSPSDKLNTLKNYKFSVCYENMRDIKGYITEKIFDCFAVGTVPIYWGASNVTDFIPKECFIDRRDFKTFDDVMTYIHSMDATTYETYQKNIEAFLKSDQAKLFSQEMFNVIFLEAIKFP
jgi:alpha(1,3/1,4) fucosyltransferase